MSISTLKSDISVTHNNKKMLEVLKCICVGENFDVQKWFLIGEKRFQKMDHFLLESYIYLNLHN